MELLYKIRDAYLIIVIIAIVILAATCSKEPLKFDNPNDPESKIYIESEISSGYVKRISYSTGEIIWVVCNPDEDIEEFNIYRYVGSLTDTVEQSIDKKFTVSVDELEYDEEDSAFIWLDTTLIFNNEYKYRIAPVASGIESNKAIEFGYFHGFIVPDDVEIEQTSDTSISVVIREIDTLADSTRITWCSSGLTRISVLDNSDIDFVMQWEDGTNDLSDNQIIIEYSYVYNDSVHWVNVFTGPDFVLQFPAVENFSAVMLNESIIRLIWQYPYPSEDIKIQATSFLIKRDDIAVDSVATTQQILDETFFVYYDEMQDSANYEFYVIPITKYHQGNAIGDDYSSFTEISEKYSNYVFVDTAFGSQGVYINLYEVSNAEFCNWAKDCMDVEDFSLIDFTLTDFDSTFEYNADRADYPARGIPYGIAEKFATSQEAELPSNRVWMLAASASVSSQTYRDYPWGYDAPGNKANYQMNFSGPVSIDSLSKGRVKINSDYDIWGPYNMAGNVMEWVADTSSCIGALQKSSSTIWYNCKGGNWRDGGEYLLIWENYCQPQNLSDEVIGFRLMKR